MSDTITDVRLHIGDPIVAIRDMVKGHHMDVAKITIIRIGRSSNADVIIDHPHVSRRHAEIMRVGPAYRLVSVGRNPVDLLGTPIREGQVRSGDWMQVTDKHVLLLLSQLMVDAIPAVEFFLDPDKILNVSRLLHHATSQRPLPLVGGGREARERFAHVIHRISRQVQSAFVVAASKETRESLDEKIASVPGGTIYVDLQECPEVDVAAAQAAALRVQPLVRLILGAASADAVRERLPQSDRPVAEFRVPELAARRDRLILADRVLAAHGLEEAKHRIGVDVLRYVVDHECIQTLGQLWRAPVRLAALVETKGVISSANALLRRWGHRQGENTLGDWVRRLEIDPRFLWGDDRRLA